MTFCSFKWLLIDDIPFFKVSSVILHDPSATEDAVIGLECITSCSIFTGCNFLDSTLFKSTTVDCFSVDVWLSELLFCGCCNVTVSTLGSLFFLGSIAVPSNSDSLVDASFPGSGFRPSDFLPIERCLRSWWKLTVRLMPLPRMS